MTDTTTQQTTEPIEAQAEIVEPAREPAAEEQASGETAHLPARTEGPQFPEAQQRVSLLRTFVDLAARIAGTEFVPKGLRGKPAAVLACILTGQEMGIGPMQSLSHIHIVDGKPTQSAELMRAQIMRAGHRFSVVEKSNEKVTVYGRRADTGEDLTITWTMADANRAKLVKADGAWTTYPRAMLMARATSELARDLFADVLGGVGYTPEELGAEVIVTDGGFIDVASTESGPVGVVPEGGGVDPTRAWDVVNAMKPREVVEELKRRGLPCGGKADELRSALAEALQADAEPVSDAQNGHQGVEAADQAPEGAVEPVDASDVQPPASDAPSATAAETATDAGTPDEVTQEPARPSTKAQAVKRAKAAVDEMADEQVATLVAAYEHEPIEDPVHRRGQLIGLMVEEWEQEADSALPGTEDAG